DENADELADGLDVAREVRERLRLVAGDGAREAGADRVDEDEIRDVEQRVVVVDESAWWRHRHARLVRQLDPPRPERPQVEPDRRRARAAVEAEHDRS